MTLFDPMAWRDARWTALTFSLANLSRPTLGLVFEDRDMAEAIFMIWRQILGPFDTQDRIRVAFIEGDLRGRSPGYSVHLSVNREAPLLAGFTEPDLSDAWCRIPGVARGSLRSFRRKAVEFNEFHLAPAHARPREPIVTLYNLGIGKRRVVSRQVADVQTEDDPDFGVLEDHGTYTHRAY